MSYYYHLGDTTASNKLGVVILPMFLTICNLVSPLGPILLKKMDVSILLGIGLLVMNISVLCLSFVKSFWAFIIIYAAIMPAGRGLYFYVFH